VFLDGLSITIITCFSFFFCSLLCAYFWFLPLSAAASASASSWSWQYGGAGLAVQTGFALVRRRNGGPPRSWRKPTPNICTFGWSMWRKFFTFFRVSLATALLSPFINPPPTSCHSPFFLSLFDLCRSLAWNQTHYLFHIYLLYSHLDTLSDQPKQYSYFFSFSSFSSLNSLATSTRSLSLMLQLLSHDGSFFSL